MNILAIGNSFSQDATRYLHQVAKADGEDITVINLYIGGCSLERHYKNIVADAPEYDLQFNGESTKVKVSVRQALISRKWDVITLQQCSPKCTVYGSYQPYLNRLAEYVRFYAPDAELVIHQTWAYERDSSRLRDLMGYSRPEYMYRDLKDAYDRAARDMGGVRVLPCGDAFIRLAQRGIVHHRDTFHASYGLGRYTLALVWYEMLTGRCAVGNALRVFDEEITEEGIRAAQECAHEAVEAQRAGKAAIPTGKRKVAVFDLDGTLVDSMPYFTKGMLSIADEAGLTYGPELIKILTPLGYTKSAEYYVNELGVQDTVPSIVKRIERKLVYEYTNNIVLKPGVLSYLKQLRDEGARLFVLTASPHIVTDACLRRNGVFDWFEQVWSVEDFKLSKSDTRIFFEVAKTVGCEVGDVHYFDDSLIALRNAQAAGYITYGVYDAQTEEEIEVMKGLSSTVVMSFEDLN